MGKSGEADTKIFIGNGATGTFVRDEGDNIIVNLNLANDSGKSELFRIQVTTAMTVVAAPHYLVMHLNSVATNTATRHHLNVILVNPVVMLLSPAVMLNRIATTAIHARKSELNSHPLDLPLALLQIYAAAVPNLVTPLLNASRATTRKAGLCLNSLKKNTPPTKPTILLGATEPKSVSVSSALHLQLRLLVRPRTAALTMKTATLAANFYSRWKQETTRTLLAAPLLPLPTSGQRLSLIARLFQEGRKRWLNIWIQFSALPQSRRLPAQSARLVAASATGHPLVQKGMKLNPAPKSIVCNEVQRSYQQRVHAVLRSW